MADVTEHVFGLHPCLPLKTDQETSYATGDDGDLELGISKSFTITDVATTINITINSKTHALSDDVVQDNRTGLMWARYVPNADIGPATNGMLFWEEWELADKTDISFDNATGEIRSAASEFNTSALCAGRKLTVTGTDSNDGTYTVSSITTGAITTVEGVADEAAGDTVTITTVDDLIWDALDQANANSLGGYTDWRIPNWFEVGSILDLEECGPTIDTTVFPSTPSNYHWCASTRPCDSSYAFGVHLGHGYMYISNKQRSKYYVRFVRG